MAYYAIEKELVHTIFNICKNIGDIIGPVQKKSEFQYRKITEFDELALSYKRTILPIKKILIPQKISVFNITGNSIMYNDIVQEKLIVFGIHPCEIHAIQILDHFFLKGKYEDPYYKRKREDVIIIGHSCFPDDSCVCNVLNTDKVNEGYDIFLYELTDHYICHVITANGEKIMQDIPKKSFKEDLVYKAVIDHYHSLRNEHFRYSTIRVESIQQIINASFDNGYWDSLGDECLSCGICSNICPTCSCYNVDDVINAENNGVRMREWDSCHLPQFSAVAGNIDFRSSRSHRLKTYYQHKLISFGAIGKPACVGCGRCIKQCPKNINVKRVMTDLRVTL
ncbi:MAG: 4Fe-4S dicluster domain-containing protein [Candidatus Heimdallarchaeota archaeon]|nr:4Fe-4S dicluster domain-containing protein [Candidatus Heimdallarchaeota archaeon]